MNKLFALLALTTMVMSPDDPGAGGGGVGGAGDGDKTKDTEQFEKLKKEKENWKKAADDAKAEAARLAAELASKTEAEMKQKEDFKSLAELKETQRKEWEEKFNQLDSQLKEKNTLITTSMKRGAVKKELMANGVDEKATEAVMRLVDLDQVKIDDESKTVHGVDLIVKGLRETLPQVFGTKVNIPGGGAPNGTTDNLSVEGFGKLSLKEMKEKQFDLMKAQGVSLKK